MAIFGVYKWNQGQGIININDAKLTSSKVMVVAQNDGTLTELLVNDGDKVEAGQVIAKMKVVVTPEQIEALQKAYDEAKVNYDNLEQQVKASMVVSQPVVTSSSTGNVAAAQARLDAAAANKQKMDKIIFYRCCKCDTICGSTIRICSSTKCFSGSKYTTSCRTTSKCFFCSI